MSAEGGEPLEVTALRTNLNSITAVLIVGSTLQWFANCLVEKAFITRYAAQGILGVGGVTPASIVGQLMDSVFAIIQTSDKKREWFNKFVSIFSANEAHAELVRKLKSCVGNGDQHNSTTPHNHPLFSSQPGITPAPLSPAILSPPASGSEGSPGPFSPGRDLSPSQPSRFYLEMFEKLQVMFANLNAQAVTEISEKEARDSTFLGTFRSHLLLLPVRKTTLHVKFFNAKDIVEAQSTKIILAFLCHFIDFRNYEVLYYVVLNFCSLPLQKSMNQYCKLLDEFETATTVDMYLNAVPNEVNMEILTGFYEMVVKIDKPESQCTLLEIRKLSKAIIEKSALCSHSVYNIGAVSRNCVVVRFRFPSSAVGWVLAAITPEFMATHHITEVTMGGCQLSVIQGKQDELVCVILLVYLICVHIMYLFRIIS